MENHFALFQMPARFDIDAGQLDAAYRELQGRVHPDKFAAASDAARDIRDEVGSCQGTYDNPQDLSENSWTVMRYAEVEEAGKLAAEVLFPLNRSGDEDSTSTPPKSPRRSRYAANGAGLTERSRPYRSKPLPAYGAEKRCARFT